MGGQRTDLSGVEEEQIHVGSEGHLAPRVTAYRGDAHPRTHLAPIGVILGFGQPVEPTEEPVESV